MARDPRKYLQPTDEEIAAYELTRSNKIINEKRTLLRLKYTRPMRSTTTPEALINESK